MDTRISKMWRRRPGARASVGGRGRRFLTSSNIGPRASTPGTSGGRGGTAYDDGWRATNRLLVSNGAQAQHERNVLLRNNGHGGFDEVSGTAGLDVDQDGRSFAVFDYDQDRDADVILMAPRSSPQLRLFRNDYAAG